MARGTMPTVKKVCAISIALLNLGLSLALGQGHGNNSNVFRIFASVKRGLFNDGVQNVEQACCRYCLMQQ